MSLIPAIFVEHGRLVLFALILLARLGLQLRALPWILTTATLVANGQLRPVPVGQDQFDIGLAIPARIP